jgi:Arc/MetJ-type ribon-helix-helix transcriptional regulator
LAPKKKQKESTPTLREEMLDKLSAGVTETKRDIPVMTRMDSKLVELLDILVKLNIFQSRSEAVASIVEKMLFSQLDKFELLKEQLKKLDDVHETAMGIAQDVLRGEG